MLLLFGYLVICVGLVFGDRETWKIGGYSMAIDNHILQSLEQISIPLDNLDLSGRQLNGIKGNAFVYCYNLKTLKLDHNNLSNAQQDYVFPTLENLQVLSLSHNRLSSVNSLGLFPNSLKSLVLRNNKIVRLDRSIFNNLNNLIKLDLSNNKITRLEKGVFNGLPNLFSLNLCNNQITAISHDSWQGLSANLKILDLRNNNIKKLEKRTFSDDIPSLHLDISENKITEIESETFNSRINVLYLRVNLLATLGPESFKGMSNLGRLDISGNSIKVLKLSDYQAFRYSLPFDCVVTHDTLIFKTDRGDFLTSDEYDVRHY